MPRLRRAHGAGLVYTNNPTDRQELNKWGRSIALFWCMPWWLRRVSSASHIVCQQSWNRGWLLPSYALQLWKRWQEQMKNVPLPGHTVHSCTIFLVHALHRQMGVEFHFEQTKDWKPLHQSLSSQTYSFTTHMLLWPVSNGPWCWQIEVRTLPEDLQHWFQCYIMGHLSQQPGSDVTTQTTEYPLVVAPIIFWGEESIFFTSVKPVFLTCLDIFSTVEPRLTVTQ